MKILLVSPLPPPMGGIATLTNTMLEKFSNINVDVECVNIARRTSASTKQISRYSYFKSIIVLLKTIRSIIHKCKKKRYDIIHINSSSGRGVIRDYIIELISRYYGIPVVLHYHCNLKDSLRNHLILKTIFKRCIALSNRIIVLNKLSQQYIKQMGYPSVIIPNGIESSLIYNDHIINNKIRSAVFTGRVTKRKGCMEIIECAKTFTQIEFLLAGLIDEDIKENISSVENIVLLGPLSREKVIEHLDKADVFLFPSYSEGFSISLLEAMARGVPCIASDVGANYDMLENKGGIIISARNSKELIDAMIDISPQTIRSGMSDWNIEKVRKYYSVEKMIELLLSVYQDVI